jgi:hypothetical protein
MYQVGTFSIITGGSTIKAANITKVIKAYVLANSKIHLKH